MIDVCYSLTVGVLGIFVGAQITEGVLFVPYWKSLSSKDFFELHKRFGQKIYQFFAPLTIIATIVPITTAIYAMSIDAEGKHWALLSGVFTLSFFSTYYLYFKSANKKFAEASISEEELPAELVRWGKWHWGRIYLQLIALAFALVAVVTA